MVDYECFGGKSLLDSIPERHLAFYNEHISHMQVMQKQNEDPVYAIQSRNMIFDMGISLSNLFLKGRLTGFLVIDKEDLDVYLNDKKFRPDLAVF
jgi:hypothetical protein